jgi:hypothetical protein
MKQEEEQRRESKSIGISLVLASLGFFALTLNILGVVSTPCARALELLLLSSSIQDNKHDEGDGDGGIGAELPLVVVLSLTTIPGIVWLIVHYVSLRLHLGRQ